MKKKKITALVLQGGGPLGAFEYGACKALFEQKDFKPDIISGVSVGACTAAIIAGSKVDDPMEALGVFWDKCSTIENPFFSKDLNIKINENYNPGFYCVRPEVFFLPEELLMSKVDTSPLYSNLDSLIDQKKLNSGHINVVVTATNVETGELEEFDNQGEQPLTLDHIVASCSIPPHCASVKIGNNHYWDGALVANMPLAPAFLRLEQLSADENIEREIFIIEIFPKNGDLPTNLAGIQDRMRHIQYSSKVHNESSHYERMNKYIDMVKELDKELLKDSPVRDMDPFKELLQERKINKVTLIEHTEPELLEGVSDWTKSTISKRVEQGYNDGIKHLSK
jgi:predicted acylesterase/phospholipase RssA